jgi:pSer/pThr/pTyr-binding forkhead associated (FHA) protein
VLNTGDGERVVVLDARVTTFGRGAEADVRLSDSGVSRLHAEVRVEAGSVVVADLGSTNGTRVGGRPVREATVLRDGDVVELGGTRLTFHEPGAT